MHILVNNWLACVSENMSSSLRPEIPKNSGVYRLNSRNGLNNSTVFSNLHELIFTGRTNLSLVLIMTARHESNDNIVHGRVVNICYCIQFVIDDMMAFEQGWLRYERNFAIGFSQGWNQN